ncbi:MAG TPA: TadE family protein [Pyrinomonadaceae bacterium]|nr:TadE family protein [Pyrinomonadaceae bacterium]
MRRKIKIFDRVRRFLKEERGTQILELAIAMPVMLLLLASVGEFARFFYTYTTLTNAVRGGARHACKWERGASWTVPETSRMVVYGDFSDTSNGPILPGLTTANVAIDANGPSINNIDSVTVRITGYNYTPIFDLGALTGVSALSLNVPMNASATMHQLYNGPTAGS